MTPRNRELFGLAALQPTTSCRARSWRRPHALTNPDVYANAGARHTPSDRADTFDAQWARCVSGPPAHSRWTTAAQRAEFGVEPGSLGPSGWVALAQSRHSSPAQVVVGIGGETR